MCIEIKTRFDLFPLTRGIPQLEYSIKFNASNTIYCYVKYYDLLIILNVRVIKRRIFIYMNIY